MITLSIILTSLAILYFFIGLLLQAGLGRKHRLTADQPFVSVLIAARNEEKNLAACLDSLAANTYPVDKHEIIIIDDRSSDKTPAIARDYTARYTHFKLLTIDAELNGLRAKMNALAQAVDQANGTIILITDADCQVGKNWIAAMTAEFSGQTALAAGLTLIDSAAGKNRLFDTLQSLDILFLLATASGTAGIGLPVSILGNNFAFKKNVYEYIGGFRQIGFSLTEDMALMQKIAAERGNKITFRLNQRTAIVTQPLRGLKDFFSQRQRWLNGGKTTTIWGFVLMLSTAIVRLSVATAALAGFWTTPLLLLTLAVVTVDLSLIYRVARRVGRLREILYFPLFELFFTVYTLILTFSVLLPISIKWKDIKYRNN